LFKIIAHWRCDTLGFEAIESVYELIMTSPLKYVDNWWLANLNHIYKKRADLNEKRAKSMKFSTAFFGLSILTILIYLIVLIIYTTYISLL
jgi:hypothetical protein